MLEASVEVVMRRPSCVRRTVSPLKPPPSAIHAPSRADDAGGMGFAQTIAGQLGPKLCRDCGTQVRMRVIGLVVPLSKRSQCPKAMAMLSCGPISAADRSAFGMRRCASRSSRRPEVVAIGQSYGSRREDPWSGWARFLQRNDAVFGHLVAPESGCR